MNKDDERIRRICDGDEKAFEELFFKYYSRLCGFAVSILKSQGRAKDCVQEVFLKIWRNREEWEIHTSLPVYLYQAVRNQALNQLDKQKNSRYYHKKFFREGMADQPVGAEGLTVEEEKTIKRIWKIAEQMPERRRLVFELHRKHGLKYKEIACVMGIERKTVENHMGRALQEIRDRLDCP